jgi:hypothetical protein
MIFFKNRKNCLELRTLGFELCALANNEPLLDFKWCVEHT